MIKKVCAVAAVFLLFSQANALSRQDFQVLEVTQSGDTIVLRRNRGVVDMRSMIVVKFSDEVKKSGETTVLVRAFKISRSGKTVEVTVPLYSWIDTSGRLQYIARRADIKDAEIELTGMNEFDRIKVVVYDPNEGQPLPSQTFVYTLRRTGFSFGSITGGPSPHVSTVPVVVLQKGASPVYKPAMSFTFYRVSRNPLVEHFGLFVSLYQADSRKPGIGLGFAVTAPQGDILQVGVSFEFSIGGENTTQSEEQTGGQKFIIGTTITSPIEILLNAIKGSGGGKVTGG